MNLCEKAFEYWGVRPGELIFWIILASSVSICYVVYGLSLIKRAKKACNVKNPKENK